MPTTPDLDPDVVPADPSVRPAPAAPFALTRLLFPSVVTAAFAGVRELPPVALVFLALVLAPILLFELACGLWLLVKGVRTGREGTA